MPSRPTAHGRTIGAKGAYTYETDMESMIEECAPRMAQAMGWKLDEAVSLLGVVLPHLERWKKECAR